MDPREDQLPVDPIVQLLVYCAGVAEVNVRVPVRAFLASAEVGPKELGGSYIHFNPQFIYMGQYSNCFFFQAEDGIRDVERSRGLGDVYKRQII